MKSIDSFNDFSHSLNFSRLLIEFWRCYSKIKQKTTIATCTGLAHRSWIVVPQSDILRILANFHEFAESNSVFIFLIEGRIPQILNIKSPSGLFYNIGKSIFTG